MNEYLAIVLATAVAAVFIFSGFVLFVAGVLAIAKLLPGDEEQE